MKKISRFVLIAALFGMVACGSNYLRAEARKEIDFSTLESNDFTPIKNSETLGTFDLVSPFNGAVGDNFTEFSWEACENADTYTLEVCSSELFIDNNSNVDYYSKNNITTTSFKIHSSFILKETTYYWRVFAVNSGESKRLSSSTFSFYVKAQEMDEVEFPVGDADDWALHSLGSYADISIDENNFFGNDRDSVVVSFKGEDTNKGADSDGWIIVTKTVEKSTYGTDALYFNMYYAGQDAKFFIRLIDRDNEYWYAPAQLSTNAKQTVIIKFSDFVQRTKDVYVGNETFDHERIKYMEIVFEKTFGDGVFLLSGVKAIKYENYKSYFVDKLNFAEYDESAWVFENYNFETVITEDELKIEYYGNDVEGKTPISNYGFAKLNINRCFIEGDSIKMTVKASGTTFSNIILRIYEEDEDRWSYKIPLASIEMDEYVTFIIPYKAFAKSSIVADGKRQFYYIYNLQFGLEGAKGTGEVCFKDFEIVTLSDFVPDRTKAVQVDGLIEDFNEYKHTCEMYYSWDCSTDNKDEYMTMNSTVKVGKSNKCSGQFEYKADMADAVYTLPISCSDSSFTSFNFLMKDASIKVADEKYSHLENVSPDIFISLKLKTGEIYQYVLVAVENLWNQYEIAFSDFYLSNGSEITYAPEPLKSNTIETISFSMKYYYFNYRGKADPSYADGNIVYMDNIAFGHASETSITLREVIVHPDQNGVAMVEDFESYQNSEDMNEYWSDGRTYEYQYKELSNDVPSNGGTHSGKLKFLTKNESPSYYISPTIGSDVTSKGIKISMKCDVEATVYLNLYIAIGSSTIQYRAPISSVGTVWTEYKIGLNNFSDINGSGRPITFKDLVNISRISIGVVYYNGDADLEKFLYVDNIAFDDAIGQTTDERTILD